jgi:tungstate transport system ATP-binding protein
MAEGAFRVEARRVSVRFRDLDALRNVDLVLDGRSRVAVLGPNGAGKSVLLRTLHGLLAPSTGEVLWNGSRERARDQAMVFQRPVMLRRTARGNVDYALAMRGIRGVQRTARCEDALARVGLAALAERPARVLSGGEQQRLALARAWALAPGMLFLDEPTSSLDPAAAAEVERVMGEIHGAGTALVFTTHHLGLARRASDEVLFMQGGRVVERAATADFFARPHSEEARLFLEGELP